MHQEDTVTKRNGTKESISFDKILNRVKSLGDGLSINFTSLTKKISYKYVKNYINLRIFMIIKVLFYLIIKLNLSEKIIMIMKI